MIVGYRQLIVGVRYRLNHSRFGCALVEVIAVAGDEWIDVLVVEGVLRGIGSRSLAEVGDTKRVRDCHCTFQTLEGNAR